MHPDVPVQPVFIRRILIVQLKQNGGPVEPHILGRNPFVAAFILQFRIITQQRSGSARGEEVDGIPPGVPGNAIFDEGNIRRGELLFQGKQNVHAAIVILALRKLP
ncbi:hypothetical protein D3C73_1275250 [compost metagenome]